MCVLSQNFELCQPAEVMLSVSIRYRNSKEVYKLRKKKKILPLHYNIKEECVKICVNVKQKQGWTTNINFLSKILTVGPVLHFLSKYIK